MAATPPVQQQRELVLSVSSLPPHDRAVVRDIVLANTSGLSPGWLISDTDEGANGSLLPPLSGLEQNANAIELRHSGNASTIFELNRPLSNPHLVQSFNRIGTHYLSRIQGRNIGSDRNGTWIGNLVGGLFGRRDKRSESRRLDILLAGSTGSGKTTALNTISSPVLFDEVAATNNTLTTAHNTSIAIDYGFKEFDAFYIHMHAIPDQARFARMIKPALTACNAVLILADATSEDPINDVCRQIELLSELGAIEHPLLIAYTHLDVRNMPKNFTQRVAAHTGFRIPAIPLDPRDRGSVTRVLSLLANACGTARSIQ
ncbi:MAG: hypothetical protein LBV45_05175 [Xanthomonadaceae bacterium]|jgi:signal recognition particle receptor subunit beta|nr:hypothetical protein [Xanthomonadaceae bacterium]